jgi:hypothetical protein
MKPAHQRTVRRDETRRLSHINFLLKDAIKKGIVNVNLLNIPLETESKSENDANSNRFYDWRVSV